MRRQPFPFKPVWALVWGLALACSGAFAQEHGDRDDRDGRRDGAPWVATPGAQRDVTRGSVQEDRHGNGWGDHHKGRQGTTWNAGRGEHRDSHGNAYRGKRYHYRNGRWYTPGVFGWEFAASAPVAGALVETLPPQCAPVVVEDTTYYYDDLAYYEELSDGTYTVVQPPAVTPAGVLTVNIPNAGGGYTAVPLRRSGTGFIGPQGEFYRTMPTVEQLRALYGQ